MNRRAFLRLLNAPLLAPLARGFAQSTLYAQSLQTELARAHPHLELLLFDARRGDTLADTFVDPSPPIPVGSLLKPFLAFAYLGQPHPPRLAVICHGHADLCWKADGHGMLSLPQALGQSCNAFFLALAATLPLDRISLPQAPPDHASPEDLIGLTPRWRITPAALLRAYVQLLNPQLLNTRPAAILQGLSLAATTGTASRIGSHPGGVLAKTGTAPCISSAAPCQASGDGLVFAAVPAAAPMLFLLVRRRASTGAIAAASAGAILKECRALHAV